jgi:cystathionine beta-lyase
MILKDGRYELDLVDFERKITTYKPSVFMMVNPQNPTGRVFTQSELENMVDICERNNVLIISDEVHCFITYDGNHHIPILKVSEKAQKISIQLFSLSKGYNMMSLPHAMTVIANPELQKRWLGYLFSYDFHYATNSFAMASVTAAAREGDAWLKECTAYLQQNMEKFLRFVEENQIPIKPLRPEASYLLWIDCRESGIAPEALGQAFLDRAGISLNSGLDHGSNGSGFVRLNFAVTHEIMDKALVRIKAMFE